MKHKKTKLIKNKNKKKYLKLLPCWQEKGTGMEKPHEERLDTFQGALILNPKSNMYFLVSDN